MIEKQDEAQRLRKRLWGAAVLIAIAVIVLPMILDGAGSESQQRVVEQLREEPSALDLPVPELAKAVTRPVTLASTPATTPAITPTVTPPISPVASDAATASGPTTNDPLTVWVVQAGAFEGEDNALQLRNRLRSAGFATFVQDRAVDNEPFLVLVGPLIKQQSAAKVRDEVARLLDNNPVVTTYQ